MRRSPLLSALAAAFLTAACARSGGVPAARAPSRWPGAPVFLISVDTLRADRLPLWGFRGLETPAIDALARDGIRAANAFSQAPLTVPSHGTIFTGLLPPEHGLRDNLGYRLSPSAAPLAETLKRAGYQTGAAVSSVVLTGSTTGLSRGFDLYDDAVDPPGDSMPLSRVQRAGDATLLSLTRWLEGRSSERVFGFLHLYEPHSPYEPPEPFRTRYAADPYAGEIAAADALVGRFVAELKRLGLYDKSVLVLLSDHGEGLGDHGESEHGVFLYREVLHVPLIVKLPGNALAGKVVTAPVGLCDVAPTLVGLLGLEGAPPGSADLIAVAEGAAAPERVLYAESLFPRIHFGWSELFSLSDGRWQYIKAPRPELYDQESDPAERANLVADKPPPLRRLVAELERRRPGFVAPSATDPEQAKKLASLGYLSAAAPSSSADGPLPDPKDELQSFERIKTGLKDVVRGNYAAALVLFDEALEQNPRMLDVWELRSMTLEKLGRGDEALASMKKAAALAPAGSTTYVMAVANLALRLGRADEATASATVAGQMGDASADELLARAWLAKGDLAQAERFAASSLESPRSRGRGLLVLARVEERRGRPEAALARLDELAARRGAESAATEVGYHWLRGDLLARLGREPEAERELREEVRRHPANLSGWTSLVALYAAQGRRQDARATVVEMLRADASPPRLAAAVRALRATGDSEGATKVTTAFRGG